jgi:hypothetical protein
MQRSSVTTVVLSSLFAFTIISPTVGQGADGIPPSATASEPSQGATNGFQRNWFAMVGETQAEQPHWATPVATVTPRLEQEFRFDLSRQVQPDGTTVLENFDGSKGLEFIPQRHVEILINLPPYLVRSEKRVPDGFGDVSFVMKYRILSANEQHGNYILTAFLGGSIPTGSYTNGTKEATITPTLAAGKGWGNLDAITTFGAILPIAETSLIGRQIVWNTTFQYRVLRKIWPEVEINSTFFSDGPSNGKKQAFVTPGFVLGKFPIWHRLGLTIGTGVQIAATQFHTYNHRYILTVRIPF